jgi:hypothetical protein
LPQRAADYEAQQGVESFARWARNTLAPALRATEMHGWDDMHRTCSRFGVVLRLNGNGLVFEDMERGIRVKAPRPKNRRGFSQPTGLKVNAELRGTDWLCRVDVNRKGPLCRLCSGVPLRSVWFQNRLEVSGSEQPRDRRPLD